MRGPSIDDYLQTRSQRLLGLVLLHAFRFPVPDWRLVKDETDIAALTLGASEHGWTIRTARLDGQSEYGRFFANNVPVTNVAEVLRARLSKNVGREACILYPSWDPLAFVNVLIGNEQAIIEGVYGHENTITRSGSPDFSFPDANVQQERFSQLGPPMSDRLKAIMRHCRKLPYPSYHLEASVTRAGKVVFYDLFGVNVPLIDQGTGTK